MSKQAFAKLPKWKRDNKKKDRGTWQLCEDSVPQGRATVLFNVVFPGPHPPPARSKEFSRLHRIDCFDRTRNETKEAQFLIQRRHAGMPTYTHYLLKSKSKPQVCYAARFTRTCRDGTEKACRWLIRPKMQRQLFGVRMHFPCAA